MTFSELSMIWLTYKSYTIKKHRLSNINESLKTI